MSSGKESLRPRENESGDWGMIMGEKVLAWVKGGELSPHVTAAAPE